MWEFLRSNSAVIPFFIAAMCNLWVGIDIIWNKREIPLGLTFMCYAAASSFLCWHYLVIGEK